MHVSLIYLLLALHVTITDANSTADRLGLPYARICDLAQVQDFPLLPPREEFGDHLYVGLSAAVRTWNLNFAVRQDAIGVAQLSGATGMYDWQDNDHQEGVPRGSVTDKMAYQQARGWLEKMGVDVVAMEKEHPPRTEHLVLPLTSRKTVSSSFCVKWVGTAEKGRKPRSAVEVSLNASRNWLVSLDVNDLAFYRYPLPQIPHAVAVNLLPDEPVWRFFHLRPNDRPQRIFTEWGFGYTNALTLLQTSPPYEAEGRRLLLAEAKNILSILECDQLDKPSEQNLTDIYVNPPAFGSGGRLEFRNGEMYFDTTGRLRLFHFLPRGQTNYYVWLSTKQSLISSNEAYQIAAQKVAALSIDVEKLDRDCRRTFARGRFYRYDSKNRRVWFDTPEYWLEWKDRTNSLKPSLVMAGVYGDLKQIGHVELRDTRYWKRPPVIATDPDFPPTKAGGQPTPARANSVTTATENNTNQAN